MDPDVSLAPADSLSMIRDATERVLTDVRALADADLRAPSALPDWSRGHVVTHLARNADGLAILLVSARTGEQRPMYASQDQRNTDIEAGAGRSAAEMTADLVETHQGFTAEADRLTDWSATVFRTLDNPGFPVELVPLLRLGELEIHHTDLDVGYGFDRWPTVWAAAFLSHACRGLSDRAGEPLGIDATDTGTRIASDSPGARIVEGPVTTLLAWVTGRHDGHDLRVAPDGPLPDIGSWR
ncbi:MAG TPA: maleylpyruvate isomerase family mycothiol-dependent enzyme [Nocardioidaceae bacterium]|nr:maleylpyruvate isomerase family mycothiol-dependent enzyme [Nocardioidaceae bacterium]